MFSALFTNPFLLNALLAGFIASITSGIMGSFVVIKRIVFLSGSIAHSVLGGMGFCLWLHRVHGIEWITPLHGAIGAAILAALIIGWIHLRYREREDTVIAALWSTGMAIGVIFVTLTPGYNVELMNYLFGNILWVTRNDLIMLLTLDVIVIFTVALLRNQLIAICFDPQQASMQGVSVKAIYLLLLCLIALSVVLLIQVVGAILVITMLAIPAAIATNLTYRFTYVLLGAVSIGVVFTFLGMAISYVFNWPPGATIALVAAMFYLLNFCFKTVLKRAF